MKILISGAGVAGTYAAVEAEKRGFFPILFEIDPNEKSIKAVWPNAEIIVGDVTKKEDLEKAVKDFGPDVIVHTAALRQRAVKADPERGKLVNVEGAKLVLGVASENNLPLVYTSSDTIYGTALESAQAITEDSPLEYGTLYAETKVAAEKFVIPYEKAIILRLTSLYGPWLGSASTFNEIIRDIVKAGLEGIDFEMAVPFAQKSEQLYTKDLAVGIVNAASAENLKLRIFNIGAGTLTSYEDIAQAAKNLFNINVKLSDIDFGKERVQSVRTTSLDITSAKEELNYSPEFTIEKAMKDYAETWKNWVK